MARRTASNDLGSPRRETHGSAFDQRQPPRLPAGLNKRVRAIAKRVLECNVHLWDESQLPPILRMAELTVRYQEMSEILDTEGYVVTKANGDITKHPLVSGITSTSTAILAIERSLAVNFLGRDGSVKKAEAIAPPKAAAVKTKSDQPRVLRLA